MAGHEPRRSRKRRLRSRRHHLLWYHRTPGWYFDLTDRQEQEQAVVEHIQQLAGRYRGRIHSWDVVNEPIEPKDGRSDGLRTAVFLQTLRPEYLDLEKHCHEQAVRPPIFG